MLKDKKYYVNIYNKMVDDYLAEYEREHGNLDNADSMSYIELADEIVGYYIAMYKDDGLKVWLENLEIAKSRDIEHYTDNEVTKILTELYLY